MRYETSHSFDVANRRADKLVRPLMPFLNRQQLERIMRAGNNDQVRGSFRFSTVLQEVKATNKVPAADFDTVLKEAGLALDFPEFLYNPPASGPGEA
jgi:hypothetical protein